MRFTVKGRQVKLEPQPIVLAAAILGWAFYYYFSTAHRSPEGAQSVLFIKPLVMMLTACFVFVLFSAVKIRPGEKAAAKTKGEQVGEDRGFLDRRRIFFVASLAVYAAALTLFGYLIPSVLYIFIVCFYLGVRNPWVLMGVPLGIAALMSVAFKTLMKVPIPIWPSW